MPEQPEPWSVNNAIEAAEELYKALPKTKQFGYLGELNEVLVTLTKLAHLAGIEDLNKEIQG